MKPYKTKLSRQMLESLHSLIELLLASQVNDDDDKMHFAVLAEIKHRLYQKLDSVQNEYHASFTPAQAFALRILALNYATDIKTYTGNRLHQIANEVHKQYQ